MSELRYQNLTVDWAPACRELELSIFTHANPDELLSQSDFEAYARVFPEGFFLCIDGDRLAGQAGGICLDFDFDHPQHSIVEITGENQCGNHDPEGDWYYGTDIAVRPEYRRRGIGRQFYERRKNFVIEQGKKGIVAGGHMPGFGEHKHELSAEEYVAKVSAGEIYDATLTFQIENGFEIRGVLENYIDDEETEGWSALIVWQNPGYPKE
jgi:GNAT superfamily N-acetyltransferase